MNEYIQLKRKLELRAGILEETIRDLESMGLADAGAVGRWREHLGQVQNSLTDPLLRVAVVGTVKSGKSTLLNAVTGMDLLRRGAGIITAFVTRIRTNGEPGGWVELKPWSQVNEELNATIGLFPGFQHHAGAGAPLDIRMDADRESLSEWLGSIQAEAGPGRLDSSFMLLNGFIDGYSELRHHVGETVNRLVFDESTMIRHRQFVGSEGQAVYLRDLELHCPVPWLGRMVEIADCQGIDSPNPAHFGLLQQYLLKTHYVLFVINSRMGLREADFRLLDFLKTLRMFPQTLFVLNADLDAHPNRADLEKLADRVRKELSWVAPWPRMHVFSALYHLSDQLGADAPDRERKRLELWKDEGDLSGFTEDGFEGFRQDLRLRVSGERTRVLLGTGLSRLSLVAGSIVDSVSARKAFMNEGLGRLRNSAKALRTRQKTLLATLETLESTIAGLKVSMSQVVDGVVDRCFDPEEGPIVRETIDVIDHYPTDFPCREEFSDTRALLQKLHGFYLEFRQSLARYLVERVNLRVIELAREQEAFVRDRVERSSQAFWSLFSAALDDFRREAALLGVELRGPDDPRECEGPELEKLSPPTFSAFMDREVVGRGVLLMRFGLGRLSRIVSAVREGLRKDGRIQGWAPRPEESLLDAVALVKAEARAEILKTFREYRRNFKEQFLHLMIDRAATELMRELRARAEMAQLDFEALVRQGESDGASSGPVMDALTRATQMAGGMIDELDSLRCAVSLDWAAGEAEASREPVEP